jgi:hypothetical protein
MKKVSVFILLALFLTACHESLEDRCEREAKEYTAKHCPSKLDKNIRIDSLIFERATHTIHYYYTLTDFADQEGVMQTVDAVSLIKEELKNTTSMRVYKENKYNFRYTYHSEKDPKKVWFDITLTDKDY